jgi:mono/diheme cytochrome c family protein
MMRTPMTRTPKRSTVLVVLQAFCVMTLLAMTSLFVSGFAPGQVESSAKPSSNVAYAELSKAPQKAVARRNPLENDPGAVGGGAKLFAQHCAECHGENAEGGKGNKKGPSLLAPEVQQATPGTLFWLLTNGVVRRGMPVWSKLPEPQRWELVAYIKSLSPSSPAKPEQGTNP